MNNAFDLNGKVSLVTGCKRGIGKGMAIALATAGADIIGVSATLERENSEVEQSVTAIGRKFSAYRCNFAERENLSNEWAAKGVNVNAIAPGYIATDNTQALRDNPERYHAILERIPAGRWGNPDDFNGSIVFLASAASDYVHGTIVTVDGGWMGR